jgi:hypothetical protein
MMQKDKSKNTLSQFGENTPSLFEGLEGEDDDEDGAFASEYLSVKTQNNNRVNQRGASLSKAATDENFKLKRDNLFGIKRNDQGSASKPNQSQGRDSPNSIFYQDKYSANQNQPKMKEITDKGSKENDPFNSTKNSEFAGASTLSTFNNNAHEDAEKNEETIGTLDLGKSRRKSPLGRLRDSKPNPALDQNIDANTLTRPMTSPGVFEGEEKAQQGLLYILNGY